MRKTRGRAECEGAVQRLARAPVEESGDVRGIENPQPGDESMLSGDRRGDTPKTEGGRGSRRAPLRTYPALIFFFLILTVGAARAESIRPVATGDAALYPTARETAELVARACPRIVLGRADNSTLRELVRECDRQLEHEAQPGRACDEERDGLYVDLEPKAMATALPEGSVLTIGGREFVWRHEVFVPVIRSPEITK